MNEAWKAEMPGPAEAGPLQGAFVLEGCDDFLQSGDRKGEALDLAFLQLNRQSDFFASLKRTDDFAGISAFGCVR